MMKNRLLIVKIACLVVAMLVMLSTFPGTLTAAVISPMVAKGSQAAGMVKVAADLLYRSDPSENMLAAGSYTNVHAERSLFLSRPQRLEFYLPPQPRKEPELSLEIPEGCEVSTNLAYELTLFDLINKEREKRSLPLLTWNDELSAAARKHSVDMACNSYFSHTTPDGVDFAERISAEGYEFYAAGENLYAGDGVFNAPERSFNGWYYSAKHFDVMMHTVLTEVGIGYVYVPDSQFGGYFTADFATPE